jgi:hypothetical protein
LHSQYGIEQREFHAMAARERLLMAGNQLGKTLAGAFEMAMHLTGVYPPWWTGLMEMLDRMQTGRFKVFRHLEDWWQEVRLYHRKDGRVVKESDDVISAVRYAVVARRFAATRPSAADVQAAGLADGGVGNGLSS